MTIASQPSVFGLRIPRISKISWKKILLIGGAVTFPLYLGLDTLAALLYDGYNYKDQTPSELSAVGAQTRSLWIPVAAVYSVLMMGFGVAIWASAGQKRALRIIAVFGAAIGLLGLVGWPFAPMHQREVLAAGGADLRDTMHLILAAADATLFLLSMAFGAAAFGKRFRLYSIATIAVVLVFGFLTSLGAPEVQDNDPTPWLGIEERIAVFGSMLWYTVLAVALLRRQRPRPRRREANRDCT